MEYCIIVLITSILHNIILIRSITNDISLDREIICCRNDVMRTFADIRVLAIEDILFFSGNVRDAEKHEHPFLALPERYAGRGESNDVSAVLFWCGAARLERCEDTVSTDEEIVIRMGGNGEEAAKGTE